MIRFLVALLIASCSPVQAQQLTVDEAAQLSVDELRASVGRWDVTTDFLNEDGSVARSAEGTYEFSWVIPNRVVRGTSEIPELKQVSALLFYINNQERKVEMVSVGGDGRLWIMSGPLGGNTRTSQEYQREDGGTGQLRFTRFNVAEDSFESKMEYTTDGGKTWKPGNHQRFRRSTESSKSP